MTLTKQELIGGDRIALRQDRRNRNAFDFELFSELDAKAVQKDHIIKGIFARGETSAWIAPPGGMKSTLLTSAAVSVAGGADWFGYRNKAGPMGVVYFAVERADLVTRRLQAHRERDHLDRLPIAIVPAIINLMGDNTVPKVLATIREIEDALGLPVGLTIWDTFAKLISAGGGDENTARDQGRVFTNLQRIKNSTNAHVAIVGHTGKDESRGARGSNAILGDADMMATISGDNIRTANVIKANDGPEGPLFSFKSEVHDFGPDEDGDPQTVNIVGAERVESQPACRSNARGWTNGLRLVLKAITDALAGGHAFEHRVVGGPTVRAVHVDEARAFHRQSYVHGDGGDRSAAERQAWSRNLKEARNRNLIGSERQGEGEIVWLTA